jgi:UPF0755 protein
MAKTKKTSFLKKFIIAFLVIILIVGGVGGYHVYKLFYRSNVSLDGKKSELFYIHTGDTFEDVLHSLYEQGLVKDHESFEFLARKKNLQNNIHPGRYRLLARMSNNELINLLRSGLQEPVTVPFHSLRTKEQLVTRVCRRLEADSTELGSLLNDNDFLDKNYGLNKETAMTLFIPKNYEFWWNTSAKEFLDKMAEEYKAFWTEERKAKAKSMGLSQSEVSVLASIVQSEQWKYNDEKAVVAGLYMNRLKENMPLQSDPTLIFAIGDFTIARVYNEDKKVNSPYNTYTHTGLPPGPICIPETSSLDAVLNYQKHDYLYMCAKEDFSGRHYFAKTYEQHKVYAKMYHDALTARGINR